MGALDGQVDRMVAAGQRLAGSRVRLERTGSASPAPAETSTEHDWNAGEVLAHVSEFLPYWQGEVERVLAGSPEPVPFGRVSTDAVRTLTVDRDRTLPFEELFSRIASSIERNRRRLGGLDEAAAERRGLHPTLGEMTVAGIVERFMVSHLEEHADQLEGATDRK